MRNKIADNASMNKDQVNKAIKVILWSKYKKDCKEAIEEVEDAGYEVLKDGSRMIVKNPETDKELFVFLNKGWRECYKLYFNRYKGSKVASPEVMEHFDFVDCLNTYYNLEYWDMVRSNRIGCGKYHYKRDHLAMLKYRVKNAGEARQKTLAKIADLQKELEHQKKWLMDCEADLVEYRAKLGLLK